MPSPHKLSLSPRAEDDLADILQFTEERWGSRQADLYEASIQQALDSLAIFPTSGKARQDLPAGYRSRVVEQHVIYYRVEGTTILVSRIVHVRRAIRAELLED